MTVVQEVVKFKAKVPRVVFSELIENDAEPLALIDCDAGVILMFVGEEVVSVPAVFEVNTTVPHDAKSRDILFGKTQFQRR